MTDFLTYARHQLSAGDATLVLAGDGLEYSSCRRGVAPMLEVLEQKLPCAGCAAADKVVGKATALLFVLAGIAAVYAAVLSAPAKSVLEAHCIPVTYDRLVPRIENRDKTGLCPMEQAVLTIDDPAAALIVIQERLAQLKNT